MGKKCLTFKLTLVFNFNVVLSFKMFKQKEKKKYKKTLTSEMCFLVSSYSDFLLV